MIMQTKPEKRTPDYGVWDVICLFIIYDGQKNNGNKHF